MVYPAGGGGLVGRITIQGVVTEVTFESPTTPHSIVLGPDGNLWLTALEANKVSRLTLGGRATDYLPPTPLSYPNQIVVGPDGALWFTEAGANKIGRVSTNGDISEITSPNTCPGQPLGAFNCQPAAIARGSNNDLWFTDLKGVTRIQLGAPGSCVANSTNVCLNSGRFQVSVGWQVPDRGTSGSGTAGQLTSDTGYFWFFTQNNVELTVKVVDGRAFNNRFWVFGGALSNVAYTVTVKDTQTGQVKTYSNPAGTLASFADTSAF